MARIRRMKTFTSVDEAIERLLNGSKLPNRSDYVDTLDSLGRSLASHFRSQVNLPKNHMSHMDGYAVNSSYLTHAASANHIRLRVNGLVGPGQSLARKMRPSETIRILTGGYVPEGADSVVPQEDVTVSGSWIKVTQKIIPGQNIDRKGNDVAKGQILFNRGHTIRPQDIGLLLALGIRAVRVYSRPRVSILAVGGELTDSFEEFARGKVINSHSIVIRRLVEAAGGEAVYLGISPDDGKKIWRKLLEGFEDSDIVLTIGGSSVSEIDLVVSASSRLGSSVDLLHGIKLQPGRVAGFAIAKGRPIIFLPGLIQSAINAFTFFCYPLMKKMLHKLPRPYSGWVEATLAEDITLTRFRDFRKVVWVSLKELHGNLVAHPVIGESSRISVIARADGYIILKENQNSVHKGTNVRTYLVPGLSSG